MENSSKLMADSIGSDGPRGSVWQLREDWRLARTAHADLQMMGMPRVNLLVVGTPGAIQGVLELLAVQNAVTIWCADEPLSLPSPTRQTTLVLHDVGLLDYADQLKLLDWLERCGGRAQVISTTPQSLLKRVNGGAFIDTLYYRLNTVCVDVTA